MMLHLHIWVNRINSGHINFSKGKHHMMRIIGYLFIVAFLSGCGLNSMQIVKTQSFGAATAQIGKLGENEFINIRNDIIKMNKTLVTIDHRKKAKSLVFDKPAYVEPTAKRVAASKALKLYGELLVKLVTEDRAANLQTAANALVENTTIALGKELSEDKKGALNKIIVGFGSFWLEKKKADAIKSIVPAYEQPINDLADLLSVDFSTEAGSLGYLKAYETTAKRLKNASMRLVNAGDKYNVVEREHAVKALVMAELALNKASEIGKRAQLAIASLKTANSQLVKIMSEQGFHKDEIKNYAKQVQDLSNIYKILAR